MLTNFFEFHRKHNIHTHPISHIRKSYTRCELWLYNTHTYSYILVCIYISPYINPIYTIMLTLVRHTGSYSFTYTFAHAHVLIYSLICLLVRAFMLSSYIWHTPMLVKYIYTLKYINTLILI